MDKKCTDFVCTKAKLMVFLVRRGFDFNRIRADEKTPSRVVFIFPDSQALRDAIAEYYSDV